MKPLVAGAVLGQRYELLAPIGSGAMGTVFEATDRSTSTEVAVKLLDAADDRDEAQRRARFLREAEVCESLRHPNLVAVLDHGIDHDTELPYLVMPRLHGEDLGQVLARVGALAPEVAAPLFHQAIQGLAAAHAAKVVHRDLKPSNLFLSLAGGVVTVRVADFGLAKVATGELSGGGGLTTSHAFMGSAQYVSPEQAVNAKHVDERADVWSLGMALYHALAGAPAFARAGSFMAFLVALHDKGVPWIQETAPWIEPRLARLVHGALIRDADKRCPSMVELGVGLDMAVGFDVTRRAVTLADLVPLSAARREVHAARATQPRSWAELLRG